MTEADENIDAAELAAALGWRRDRLDLLIADSRVQSEVRSLCSVASVLREGVPPTADFEADTLAALRREGMGSPAQDTAPASKVSSIRGLIAGGLTFSFASAATVMALLATGVQAGGSSPIAVLVVGLMVGTFATWNEVRFPSEVDRRGRRG